MINHAKQGEFSKPVKWALIIGGILFLLGGYGVYRATNECGVSGSYGKSSALMMMTYNSLNPISAEIYKATCRSLN